MGSGQIQGEWEHYKKILEDSDVLKTTKWLDVRGNHGIYLISYYKTISIDYIFLTYQPKM